MNTSFKTQNTLQGVHENQHWKVCHKYYFISQLSCNLFFLKLKKHKQNILNENVLSTFGSTQMYITGKIR